MYYIEIDDEIVLYNEDRLELENTLRFKPEYKGLKIKKTTRPIVDFEWADTPEWIEEDFQKAKAVKYEEILSKANSYIAGGEALFEFEEGKHIEATDGNIGKLTSYALAFVTGALQPEDTVIWNTKEDETVELTAEAIQDILVGLGQAQSEIWAVKFAGYVAALNACTTREDVEAIEVDYSKEVSVE